MGFILNIRTRLIEEIVLQHNLALAESPTGDSCKCIRLWLVPLLHDVVEEDTKDLEVPETGDIGTRLDGWFGLSVVENNHLCLLHCCKHLGVILKKKDAVLATTHTSSVDENTNNS